MSGPKRVRYRFEYDPTPTRVDDLAFFFSKQVAWLERHGEFIRRELGHRASEEARATLRTVQECIDLEDPDAGFDCYGACWATLNGLHRQASRASRERQCRERQRRQRAAGAAVRNCHEAWASRENQALLQRWGSAAERHALEQKLCELANGTPSDVQGKARKWFGRFEQAVKSASDSAQQNARSVRSCVPRLSAALQALGELNVGILPSEEQARLQAVRPRLRQAAEAALQAEDLKGLRSAIRRLKRCATKYRRLVKAAEFRKATEVWSEALAHCGYAVRSRTEADGTVVLEATSFPMKAVRLELSSGKDEATLDVGDQSGGARCVRDVQSLQAELSRRGMVVTVTDWGRGRPGPVARHLAQNVNAGGAP